MASRRHVIGRLSQMALACMPVAWRSWPSVDGHHRFVKKTLKYLQYYLMQADLGEGRLHVARPTAAPVTNGDARPAPVSDRVRSPHLLRVGPACGP